MGKVTVRGIHRPGWGKDELPKAQETCLSRSLQVGLLLITMQTQWPLGLNSPPSGPVRGSSGLRTA